jgi:mannose/fructose/N-acetylgalactosamine-specific phosphotransferase system component IID
MTMNKLSKKEFLSIFFRSFFLQAVWNYQSMLAIGFCFSLVPVVRRLYSDRDNRALFVNRHLNFFNAHPYFSSFALGAIARIEEDAAAQEKPDFSQIERLKNALIGPLGAIGDQLVWATLKPASILIGVLGVMMIRDLHVKISFLVLILLLYNIPHLYIRMFGILEGYRLGYNVYKILNIENYHFFKKFYGGLGALALGIFVSYSVFHYGATETTHALVFVVGLFGSYYYRKWRQSFYESIFVPLFVSMLIGVLIEVL